jgi:maltooligosyltrehalose trehalohydrolase
VTSFRPSVWAPDRQRVRLRAEHRDVELTKDAAGWWHAPDPLDPGTDYAFLVDDDDTPLPDPRSHWQPEGVHGPSRAYDHAAYRWTDEAWTGRALPGSVIYELHIGTFTPGRTFDSAIEQLDYLAELGVDLVEVMPVNAFDGTAGWGYDGVLWGAVHEPYGGPDGFKRFVDACHRRGLGVVLDVVYNHIGPSGNYLDRFASYFSGENQWGSALNVDGPGSDEVRRYVIDNALGWLRDFHVDGLRLDAVHAIVDRRATHLLEELAAATDALAAGVSRPLSLIAESDLNDPKLILPREAGGYGLAAQWCDDIHHALHVALTGETQGYYADFAAKGALATTLRQAYFHDGTWSSFRQRTHGRPFDPSRIPGSRFVAYLQDHDQIGNRAEGDRLSAKIPPGLLACGAAIVLTSPYTPMIFMGEEWAASTPWQFFASFPDPDLADAVRRGRSAEFAAHGWGSEEIPDPISPATVERSTLDWAELSTGEHRTLLQLYRDLIALRHTHPELADPRLDQYAVETGPGERWLVLHRGAIRVVCNLAGEVDNVRLDRPVDVVLLASAKVNHAGPVLELPPESFAVVRTIPEAEARPVSADDLARIE